MGAIDDFLSAPAPTGNAIDDFLGPPPKSSALRRVVGDSALSLGKGVIGVPEALTGLADIVTGGRVGKAMQDVGVDYKGAKDILSGYYSPEQQAANKAVDDAKGFFPTVGAMIQNPSTIAQQALESSLTMLPGAGAARGALAIAPKIGPIVAGAIGEGATAAGQNAEQIREEDPNGTLTPGQAALQAVAGGITGGIGFGTGKLANKLGLGHIETMLAGGKAGPVGEQAIATGAEKGIARKLGEGAAIGMAQEVPQSYQEQVAQNLAQGKPWDEGAAEAAAQGGLAGGLMEAAGAPFGGHSAPHAAPDIGAPPAAPGNPLRELKVDGAGPLSRGVNALVENEATAADEGKTVETPVAAALAGVPNEDAQHPDTPVDTPPGIKTEATPGKEATSEPVAGEKGAIPSSAGPLESAAPTFDPETGEIKAPERATFESADDVTRHLSQQRVNGNARTGKAIPVELEGGKFSFVREGEPGFIEAERKATEDAAAEKAKAKGAEKPLVSLAKRRAMAAKEKAKPAATPAPKAEPAPAKTPPVASTTPVGRAPPATIRTALDDLNTRDAQTRAMGVPQTLAQRRAAAKATAALAGEPIDKDWTAFSPESGTKGIPRADMPQIKAIHRGALTNFLTARGITHEAVEIPASALKPTQAEFSPAKVKTATSYIGEDHSILVSSDGHVLDGHHQWLAKHAAGQPIKAIQLNAPIEKLVAEVKEFPSSTQAAGATEVTKESDAKPSAQTNDAKPDVQHVDRDQEALQRSEVGRVPPVRSDGDQGVPAVGEQLRAVPSGHGAEAVNESHAGSGEESSRLPAGELPVGDSSGTDAKQVNKSAPDVQRSDSSGEGLGKGTGDQPAGVVRTAEKGVDGGKGAVGTATSTSTKSGEGVAPKSPKPKRQSLAARAADAAEQKRAQYFQPGNIIRGYGGFDEVISYTPPDANGRWSVRVHSVEKVDGKWVRIGKPQDARNHSTQPEERLIKNGPIARVTPAAATEVPHSEARADGKDFPNATAREEPVIEVPKSLVDRRALGEQDRNGLRAEDRALKNLGSVASEIAGQMQNDVTESDFDLDEVRPALALVAKEAGLATDDLRAEVLKKLRAASEAGDLQKWHLRSLEKALDPLRAPPAAVEPSAVPKPVVTPMPPVADIPLSAGQAAHSGTSHTPEVRAKQEQQSFRSTLANAWEQAARIAGTDQAAIDRITELFTEVSSGYRSRTMAWLGARSRVMSSMIAGPANFPVERNRKRGETERKRSDEAAEYLARGIKRLLRAARGPIDNSPASELESVRQNLTQREEAQEQMKAANVALRTGDDEALRELGLSDEKIAELKKPDFAGRVGFPDYRLSNNNAEIRRLRERLKEAEQRMEAVAAGPIEREVGGVRVVEDATDDRLRLVFEGKPSEEVREALKSSGFRWSPRAGAWQRQLTDNARRAADSVLRTITPKPAAPYDAARAQDLRNSIAEGEQILSSGKDALGEPMSAEKLDAVRRSVESTKAKLEGMGAPPINLRISEGEKSADTSLYGPPTQAHADLLAKLQARLDESHPGYLLHAVAAGAETATGGRDSVSQARAAVATVAKRLFGHEVVFVAFEGKSLFNGVMTPAVPNTIFLNANGQRPLMAVLGHELLHQLRASNESIYDALTKRLAAVMKNEFTYREQLEARYARMGVSTDTVKFGEELTADIVGDNFMDPEFWQAMGKDQPGLFRRIANTIIKFLDSAIAKMTGERPFGTERFLTDIKAARDAVASAMREFSGTQVGALTSQADGINFSLADSLDAGLNSARDVNLPAGYKLGDLFNAANPAGRLGWWHKTVGTMHNLAQRSPEFKRVYDATQNFLNDISYYATEAANLAPTILPKLETLKDIAKSPLAPADTKALSAPVFEGTLSWARDERGNAVKLSDLEEKAQAVSPQDKAREMLRRDLVSEGVLKMWQGLPIDQYEAAVNTRYQNQVLKAGVVWTDAELKSNFGLTDKQIPLYREFRSATDKSLTNLAISDMVRFGGKDVEAVRQKAMDSGNVDKAAEILRDHLYRAGDADEARKDVLNDTAEKMIGKAERASDLMKRGYAPLSRFGQYTLDVVSPDGTRDYFGMFESAAERSKMQRQMAANFPDATITQGTVSQEAFKMFAGVTPETLELFGDMLGLEAQGNDAGSKAFQEYLKVAKSNRSAMKRLIERKGIAGFSEDAGRVLAGFVYSNARQNSSNLHMGEMSDATLAIPQQQGQLRDQAAKLTDYVKNPQEEAQALRGLLFTQYLGGSVASAMVNTLQPLQVTFPYLSQYGGALKAGKQMLAASRDALRRRTGDAALDAALHKAEEEGIVSPQEVFQLMGQAQGKGVLRSGDGTRAGDLAAKASNFASKTMLAWGKVFGAAEQYNRRVAFIAAYRTAVAQGMADPAKFAAHTVAETQFTYNKGNKPQWARGAVGGTLFTFKQFAINNIELMHRMWTRGGPEGKRAALLQLAVLFLMSGAGGLPGSDDIDDLLDGVLQRMGYNFSSKDARRKFFAETLGLGDAGAQFVEKGLSGLPGSPIDVSGRLGLGNLIPGTGLAPKKDDYTSDVAELFGPAGDLAKRAFKGGGQIAASVATGDIGGVAKGVVTMSPTAIQNAAKAYDMASTGMYKDQNGKKVIDVDGYDATAKAIGFQPNDVARVQTADRQIGNMVALNKLREKEISSQWAQAIFEKDQAGIEAARKALSTWNIANPESPIRITPNQIRSQVQSMSLTKDQRLEKSAPREIRGEVARRLQAATQ